MKKLGCFWIVIGPCVLITGISGSAFGKDGATGWIVAGIAITIYGIWSMISMFLDS